MKDRLWRVLGGLAAVGIGIGLVGCGGDLFGLDGEPGLATVVIRVNWPTSDRVIPADTARIVIEFTGPGIPNPIVGVIPQGQVELVLYVPPGTNRTLTAIAEDASGSQLASAMLGGLTIRAGQENAIQIILSLIQEHLAITVDWTEEPSPVDASANWQEAPSGNVGLNLDWSE